MLEFNLGIPQIIWITLTVFNIVYVAINHGKEQPRYNAYATLISMALQSALMYWGGFFN